MYANSTPLSAKLSAAAQLLIACMQNGSHADQPLLLPPSCSPACCIAQVQLPDLPYDYGALEPVISGKIMELHHGKHHQVCFLGCVLADCAAGCSGRCFPPPRCGWRHHSWPQHPPTASGGPWRRQVGGGAGNSLPGVSACTVRSARSIFLLHVAEPDLPSLSPIPRCACLPACLPIGYRAVGDVLALGQFLAIL